MSLIRAGGAVTAELKIEQPAIAGSDNRFMTRIQEVVGKRYACVFAILTAVRASRWSSPLATRALPLRSR